MVTALTVYMTDVASGSTLTTADVLAITTGGSLTTRNTLLGTATGYGELWPQTNGAAWAAAGSIGAPDAHGWIWDVTTLEGQQFVAGNWTPSLQIKVSVGTATGDIYYRVYKRSSGGVYTQIGSSIVLSTQVFTTTLTTYTAAATALPLMSFPNAGDKLYLDTWVNITVNGTSSSTAKIQPNITTSGTQGNVVSQVITPGYQPIPSTGGVTTFYMSRGLHVGRTQ